MWCRVLIAAVVFAFPSSLDPTEYRHARTIYQLFLDILCVLLLNGLQKEDIDVEMLAKLQRHNVNIDDLNNENFRNECITIREGNITDDKLDFVKYITPNINDKNRTSESNLQNVIINYFHNVHNSGKSFYDHEAQNMVTKPGTDFRNIDRFINNWNMMGKPKEQDTVIKYTTKAIESSTTLKQEYLITNMQKGDKNIEYINNILESLIATQEITTTSRPTTKKVDLDIIADKIKKILAQINDRNNLNPTTPVIIKEGNDLNNISEIIKLAKQLKVFGPLQENRSSSTILQIKHQNAQHDQGQYLLDDFIPKELTIKHDTISNHNLRRNNELKSVSEDMIREISESVKVKVLQDLKRVVFTTTEENKATSTTNTPSIKTTTTIKIEDTKENKPKVDTTNTFEQFMEMYQKFKASKELQIAPTTTKMTKNAIITTKTNAFVKISYPHEAADNSLNIKVDPVNITSIIINPVNSFAQTVMPRNPYPVLRVNTPERGKNHFTQMNIFNNKEYQPAPMTIQTNSVEVPPLFAIPSSFKVVYQNIVVTTKRPIAAKHDTRQRYTSNAKSKEHDKEFKQYIMNRINDYKSKGSYNSHEENDFSRFGFGTNNRHREYNNKYKENYTNKAIKHHGRMLYNNHDVQKFHEKLEGTNGLGSSRNGNNDDTPSLEKRPQHPINDRLVRSRYDDAHFRHFLKTQQKVNDMLERILATKTRGPPSVETTV